MRLLVVLPPLEEYSPLTGGAVSTVAEALASRWLKHGHDVTVLSQRTEAPYATGTVEFVRYWLPERRLGRRAVLGAVRRARRYEWPLYTRYLRDVQRRVNRIKPDWVLLHNDVVLPALLRAPHNTNVSVLLHNTIRSRARRRTRRGLADADFVAAVSAYIAEESAAAFALPAETIAVMHNGVDAEFYRGVAEGRPPHLPLRVGVIGRLIRDKGAHVMLSAVRELRERGTVVIPVVVGSPGFRRSQDDSADDYVVEVKGELQQLQGEHIPHLPRAGVRDLLARLDVLVVPSLFPDPFPLTVFEGMASGCALLVSDLGGLPEAAGDAGRVLPAGDADALAQAIADLDADRAELLQRQHAGLRRARENDWQHVADAWLKALAARTA